MLVLHNVATACSSSQSGPSALSSWYVAVIEAMPMTEEEGSMLRGLISQITRKGEGKKHG